MTQYLDQNIQNPVFNLIPKSVYEAQTELSEDELYFVDPEFEGNKVLISNGSGDLAESSTSTTELSYLSGVTSNVQTQLNSKQTTSNLVTSVSSSSTDTQYPSAKLLYNKTNNMQTTSNLVTSVSSSSTNTQYPSAKLFYDTCGDIETLINAL